MEPKPGSVFLATVTHNGQLDFMMARAFYHSPTRERMVLWNPQQSSLLAAAYNNLWSKAIASRFTHNVKWFAMLHADIVPEDFWVDKLIALAEEHNADVMSAVVPIKDSVGVTSTAISGVDHFTRKTRLTMQQVLNPLFPETFSIADLIDAGIAENSETSRLLVNTGCFVARIDKPWCERVHFTINDRIVQTLGGNLVAQVESEDWFFSRRVAEEGGKVMATRNIKLQHIGAHAYKSHEVWGHEIDPATV